MSTVVRTERRTFKMHPKLLFDVIQRQAGTLAKAILELIMNAADAKATTCDVTIEPTCVTVWDNGRGFPSKKAIEKFFEVFGQPHEEDEEKIYGTFRMGRGQAFSFGDNCWTTNAWRMDVDIKKRGLDYDLTRLEKGTGFDGCRVEIRLYDALDHEGIYDTEQSLAEWCKYAPLALTVNGKRLDKDPAAAPWDVVLPEAYIRLKGDGELAIYNLGIHVMDIPGYRYGTGGTVVSRAQLKVNFARNDVMSDCPVWGKIRPEISEGVAKETIKKPVLTDDERKSLLQRWRAGKLRSQDARKLKLFVATNGRTYSLDQLINHRFHHRITVAERGDQIADKLLQRKSAFILSESMLREFGCEKSDELVEAIQKLYPQNRQVQDLKSVDFEQLSAGLNDQYDLVPEHELTPTELVWRALLLTTKGKVKFEEEETPNTDWFERRSRRQIHIGIGPANAWTDGMSYIAFDRDYLKSLEFDMDGFGRVLHTLIHELCHDKPSSATHTHSHEFFETFHDVSRQKGKVLDYMLTHYPLVLTTLNREKNRTAARLADKQARIAKGAVKLAEFAGTAPKLG